VSFIGNPGLPLDGKCAITGRNPAAAIVVVRFFGSGPNDD
jgi:hypothetical protein